MSHLKWTTEYDAYCICEEYGKEYGVKHNPTKTVNMCHRVPASELAAAVKWVNQGSWKYDTF